MFPVVAAKVVPAVAPIAAAVVSTLGPDAVARPPIPRAPSTCRRWALRSIVTFRNQEFT